jgi:hypothetical protein
MLAAGLIVTAFVRPFAPLRVAAAVLCGLGIAVVLGHGFAPDEPTREIREVAAGGYVALFALAAGATGALATWPRRGGTALLVAAAVGIVGALLSGWGDDGVIVLFGALEKLRAVGSGPDGFARWRMLDVALLALAAGLLLAAAVRPPRAVSAALAVGALAAAGCIVVGMRDQLWVDEGVAMGAAKGPVVALLALLAGLGGLALVRPRAPAARAG